MRKINRRRFISISAATAGVMMLDPASAMTAPGSLVRWQGAALGARAEIMLYSNDPKQTRELFRRCQDEISRLERIFSLYIADSAINRLNADGYLENPDPEFLEVMSRCLSCSRITGGAFDVTVQPLWQLYADHFRTPGADPDGPSLKQIRQTLNYVGSDKVMLDSRRISFLKPGMGVTLNGIAQGYITDRITAILKDAGFKNILVYMGETYAMGQHRDGRAWTAGIQSPFDDSKILLTVPLRQRAIATSGGYGSPFSDNSRFNHLFDPATGRSADHYSSVSVIAKDTTTADMLSTAFYVMAPDKIPAVWPEYSQLEKAIFIDQQGKITKFSG
ncbi:MAG: FAD:protein FMN transferase [Alphaproteobacteria bacterium]|nr:FAD:protein FMN transferase [Alphaproteobacteria bacterium]